MTDLKLVGLSGSLRKDSTNRKLMNEAARRFGAAEFVEGNLRLPLYDGDLEAEGIPADVQELSDLIASADAVLVVTPEYNRGISGVLKNALDWVSRTEGAPWADKPVVVMSAAAGRSGGERGHLMAQESLMPFSPRLLVGGEFQLAQSFSQFDEDGRLTNERAAQSLDALMGRLRKEAERT
jgi:chromate reductase